MITFSNKSIRENYLYEIEGVRINGDVDYNDSTFSASMNIQCGENYGYGNIGHDGNINISGIKAESLEAASKAVNTFYTELQAEIESRR